MDLRIYLLLRRLGAVKTFADLAMLLLYLKPGELAEYARRLERGMMI